MLPLGDIANTISNKVLPAKRNTFLKKLKSCVNFIDLQGLGVDPNAKRLFEVRQCIALRLQYEASTRKLEHYGIKEIEIRNMFQCPFNLPYICARSEMSYTNKSGKQGIGIIAFVAEDCGRKVSEYLQYRCQFLLLII